MSYDKENMLGVLQDFPEQCKEAVKLAKVSVKGKFSSICVCGMGGSGIGGDLLKSLVNNIPIYPVHGYKLPSYVDKKCLVIAVSFSGNTEETLSCYKEAKKKKMKVISITSGGKLADLDKNAIIIPKDKYPDFQPRSAIGYLFLTMVAALSKNKIIPSQSGALAEVNKILNPKLCSKQGFLLAQKLKNKIPVFYASEELGAAAYRIKTAVNENAKQPSFYHIFPEMNHNEINGFKRNTSKLAIVFLRDKKDNKAIIRRMDITKKLIKSNVKTVDLEVHGKNLLARMMYSIYVGDFISYYLALMNRLDPTPVPVVEELKKKL